MNGLSVGLADIEAFEKILEERWVNYRPWPDHRHIVHPDSLAEIQRHPTTCAIRRICPCVLCDCGRDEIPRAYR